MEEQYKEIKGFEKLYEISNLGNVKSLAKGDGNGKRDRLLKQEVLKNDHTNYNRVSLSKYGKVTRFSTHRLVALHFLENPENKPHVNHKDNNGENNNYLNLEWVTHSENMIHAERQGRLFDSQSKAGIAAGKVAKKKQAERYKNIPGSIFGNFKVLTVEALGSKPSGVVRCLLCGEERTRGLSTIVSGKSKNCRKCGLLAKGKTRTADKCDKLVGKVFDTRMVTEARFIKNRYKVNTECTKCKKIQISINLEPLKRKRNPTKCTCQLKHINLKI